MQDNTMRAWDMRPYAPQNRCVKVFTGHQHSFERNSLRCDWSPDGTKVGYPPLSHTALSCLQHETAAPNGDQVELDQSHHEVSVSHGHSVVRAGIGDLAASVQLLCSWI